MKKITILGQGKTAHAIRHHLAEFGLEETDLDHAEALVVSPGIPPDHYPPTSLPIWSEIELGYRLLKNRASDTAPMPVIVGITGTNGKSTVTSMIAHLLQVPPCGNIGDPFINYCVSPPPYLVVELSSYQLWTCHDFRPNVAVFLNVTSDHMDWHKTTDHYVKSKAKLIQSMTGKDTIITPDTNTALLPYFQTSPADLDCVDFESDPLMAACQTLPLQGDHNKQNAVLAIKAAMACGLSQDTCLERMTTFTPLEHRLEPVKNSKNRLVLNDSKATNIESVAIAINACDTPIHLILSGNDKGEYWNDFLTEIQESVHAIITFGGLADIIVKAAEEEALDIPVLKRNSLKEAVVTAMEGSLPEETILFSPGSSSFDLFENFEDRGRQFKQVVRELYG